MAANLKIRPIALITASALTLAACVGVDTPRTMTGAPGGAEPAPIGSVSLADIPLETSTWRYHTVIYPGVTDETFDPNPTLTVEEYNQLKRLDWYCAREAGKFSGAFSEITDTAVLYGVLQGAMGALGSYIGFGGLINPEDYLAQIGFTAAGGGAANGIEKVNYAIAILHGYCMTGMVYKANELEGKLRRIWIIPMSVGEGLLPEVSNRPAPIFRRKGSSKPVQEEGTRPPPPPA